MTRDNHPSEDINAYSTGVLMAATALYTYFGLEKLFDGAKRIRSIVYLLGLGVGAAAVIYLIYENMVGPDPRRFGLVKNILMDTGFVLMNSLLANAVLKIAERKS